MKSEHSTGKLVRLNSDRPPGSARPDVPAGRQALSRGRLPPGARTPEPPYSKTNEMAKRRKKKMTKTTPRRRYRRRSPEEQIADLEERIAELREQIALREKFSPDLVYEDRSRLELSRADYAELVGVAPLTIFQWEHGKTKPRTAQLEKWLAVKKLGKRDAWKELGLV